jgi:ABC-type branched-subunit amino acid transport system substrate-binding protein
VRALAIAAAFVLAACTSTPTVVHPTPVPTHEPNTVTVSVLLDLSGPRAPSGQPQRDAMQLWLDQTQTSTVKLRVKFVDIAGSDTRLLLELRHAVVDDHADVIVVGVPASLEDSFGQAVQAASVPVLLTLPTAEPATSPGGRFAFALAPTPDTIAWGLVNDIVDRGVLAPMLLAGDDSAPSVAERVAFLAELRRRGLTGPTSVLLTQPDGPQRMQSAAAVAKSIVLTGASAAYRDPIRAIPATPPAPRVYLSYLTEIADVTSLREQATSVVWPGTRNLGISDVPLPATALAFMNAFRAKYGAPSTLAATAYDALSLIAAAADAAPSELDAARLRLRVEATTFAGVATSYSFAPGRHVGFAVESLVYLRFAGPLGVTVIAR